MGSTFAGLKAGVLAGLLYCGTIALANLIMLILFKQDALNLINQNFSSQCSSAEDCFLSVLQIYLPLNTFTNFLISIFYSSIYGRLYEYIPGSEPSTKGVTISLILLINLSLLGSVVTQFAYIARIVIIIASVVLTLIYGVILGKFYKRYTRFVEFISQDKENLKILVDGRNMTNKKATFSVRSIHKIRAEGKIPFKSWTTTGGVRIEDPRSYETSFEVTGDGVVKVVGKSQ